MLYWAHVQSYPTKQKQTMPIKFAKRIGHTRPSDIREILTKTAGGGYLSFAGGMPDPELFPVEQLSALAQQVLREHPARALQYGPTAGLLPLREKIAALMGELGVTTDSDQILIVSGAQQGIGLSGTIFLDPGEAVITERPTYSAAINALDLFRPTYLDLESDGEGPDIAQLHEHLRSGTPVRLAYAIPNFQNPSGRLWSDSRRKAFLEAFEGTDILSLGGRPVRPTGLSRPATSADQGQRPGRARGLPGFFLESAVSRAARGLDRRLARDHRKVQSRQTKP